jgi:selenocysteine lyase/cysteine desulfurase
VGRLARAAGVPYLLDACQSVGQIDLDVAAIGCDMLSATGRKFLRAPRGTGFLYVSRQILGRLEPPFIELDAADWVAEDDYALRDDARRFESWESNVAARLGLGAAVDYALSWGVPAIEARVGALAERLRTLLGEVPGVTVRDQGRRRSGIVTFSAVGWDATEVRDRLRREGINTSVVAARSTRLDLGRRGLGDLVRASVHYYNTDDELARLVEILTTLEPAGGRRAGAGDNGASASARPGRGDGMTHPRVHDDQPADPVEEPETGSGAGTGSPTGSGSAGTSRDDIPTGGNAAQAAAVFGEHNEPPAEMDSGGAG